MLATPTSSARPSTAHAESEGCRAQPRYVVGLCPARVVLNALTFREPRAFELRRVDAAQGGSVPRLDARCARCREESSYL